MSPRPRYRQARGKVAGRSVYRRAEAAVRARLCEVMGDHSVAWFAEEVRLNRESVRRALRGGTITLELVVRVSLRFNISSEWLLFGTPPRSASGRSEPVLLDLKPTVPIDASAAGPQGDTDAPESPKAPAE